MPSSSLLRLIIINQVGKHQQYKHWNWTVWQSIILFEWQHNYISIRRTQFIGGWGQAHYSFHSGLLPLWGSPDSWLCCIPMLGCSFPHHQLWRIPTMQNISKECDWQVFRRQLYSASPGASQLHTPRQMYLS